MSTGQAILALVTLVVATIVYRWQKMIDRETVIQIELRQIYAKYLATLSREFLAQPAKDGLNDEGSVRDFYSISSNEKEAYQLRDEIILLAPESVVASVKKCDQAFRAWKTEFTTDTSEEVSVRRVRISEAAQKYTNSRRELIAAMRGSLKEQYEFSLPALVRKIGSKK